MTRRNSPKRLLIGLALAAAAILAIQQLGAHRTGDASGETVVARQLETPRLMELYTPYCPSCREMDPLVNRLKAKCDNKGVQVVQVDISRSDNEFFIEEYDVSAVPTFIFIDENGRETERLVGKQSLDTIRKHLAAISGEKCG